MCHDTGCTIPHGFCHCGCGQETERYTHTNSRRGHVKGDRRRYIQNHHGRLLGIPYTVVACGYSTPCHLWRHATHLGYGIKQVGGKARKAHRVFWEEANGPVPKGLELDHLCRQRSCIRLDHLEAVTHAVNACRSRIPGSHQRVSVINYDRIKLVLELRATGMTYDAIGLQIISNRTHGHLKRERVRRIYQRGLRMLRHPSRAAQWAAYEATGTFTW